MNVRKLVVLSLCGAGLSIASLAIAQQAPQKPSQTQSDAGQRAQWQNPDQILASCVAIANQEEVAIAKFAKEKAEHKDVKEFAAMLIKDHQAFNTKLQKYAPEATKDGYLMEKETTDTGRRQTSSNERKSFSQEKGQAASGKSQDAGREDSSSAVIQQTAANDDQSGGQMLDFAQLHRELAEECIQSAKKGMSKKDGSEFDKCFIGYQIAAHAMMKNKLVVFERHVSGDLKQVLAAAVETTEAHMQKAEQIMEKLDSATTSDQKKGRSDDSK